GTGGQTSPAIMAGRYITPLVIHGSMDTDINPSEITIGYSTPQGQLTNKYMYNDFDNAAIWKDNKFYTALAYNTTHYMLLEWLYNNSIQGWERTASYLTFSELNDTLMGFGMTNLAMSQALTEFDFDEPVQYSSTTKTITLLGWLFGETNPTYRGAGIAYTYTYPGVASEQNVTVFRCNSALITQKGAYEGEPLCNIPISTARRFNIYTPNIEIYPVVYANITMNNYYNGSVSVSPGTYSYACISPNSTETITGNVTIGVGKTQVPIVFTDITKSIGYLLKFIDYVGNPVQSAQIITQYATHYTNSTGQVLYWGIRENENLNVTIKMWNKIIEYIGGNALEIGDAWNSQKYSDSGSCSGFDGLYRYTLSTSPTFKEITWKLKCGKTAVPNADVYIDGKLVSETNSSGAANFTTYKSYDAVGFNVTFLSEFGNLSKQVKYIQNETFYMTECNEAEIISQGGTQEFDANEMIGKFINPYVIGFLAIVGISAFIWLKTGSSEITAMASAGMLIIGYFVGFVPMFAVVALIVILSILLAMRFIG
ncbi:MAG: hypothetical protein QXD77_02830, partial [Candidatus Aenigmatarchaeota archaeon]